MNHPVAPGAVQHFAVIGDPIGHTKSPAMHAAVYRALGLPHDYVALRASAGDLPALVQQLRDGLYGGFNVTVPHKRAILDLVDAVAPSADAVGAANTLVREPSGKIVAHNTDVAALAQEIARLGPEFRPGSWRHALVLGSGGAARAAMAALAVDLGVSQITVRARAPERAGIIPKGVDPARIALEPLTDAPEAREFDIVVQATSAGMTGADPGDAIAHAVAWRALPAHAVALDVVYAPAQTPFLRAASAHALRSTNGLGMLARQGALAFELWLNIPAPVDIMLAALA